MSNGSQAECPLCMEPLEPDDVTFFPCTCGYQICRFCWHRIRTDENGLCPACRRSYTESPAEFKPLAEHELLRLKKEKRQRESQKKQKAAENRNHLANVRVIQKNLVFVVGLTQRLADAEVLKKHEYFGRFGKIQKIVINQSTSYAGVQGPSASAYVTYYRSVDAIRAIQTVNNVVVDGRTIKASLGTTKYCSYFLRGLSCTKPDCLYLHEFGEEMASFTKEEMQQGKHLVYEQLLYDEYNQNTGGTVIATSCNNVGSSAVNNGQMKNQTIKPLSTSSQKKFTASARHQPSRHSGQIKLIENHHMDNVSRGEGRPCNSLGIGGKQWCEVSSSVNNSCVSKQRNRQQNHTSANSKNASQVARCPAPNVSMAVNNSSINSSQQVEMVSTSQSQATTSGSSSFNPQKQKLQLPPKRNSNNFRCEEGSLPLSHSAGDCIKQNINGNRRDELEFDLWNEPTRNLADVTEKENKFNHGGYRYNHFGHQNGIKISSRPTDVVCGNLLGDTADHWISSLQQFSGNYSDFQHRLRTQFGLPFGLVSNTRPDVQHSPSGLCSSLCPCAESSSSLADGVD